ncbi:hypothetical protein A2U01_0010057 [Trifolium medium]|uniref:Uncharacterized protein n=1 Tax=Trifolium medium TaxID=97028 RepID=A0A392MSA3_9FABA|nr:hypothetical protein [Trifolium medium]
MREKILSKKSTTAATVVMTKSTDEVMLESAKLVAAPNREACEKEKIELDSCSSNQSDRSKDG